jgi:hypothetical protein
LAIRQNLSSGSIERHLVGYLGCWEFETKLILDYCMIRARVV